MVPYLEEIYGKMGPQGSLNSLDEYYVDNVHRVRKVILHCPNLKLPLPTKKFILYFFPVHKFHLLLDWTNIEQKDFLPF